MSRMRRLRTTVPSPATVVAVLALVAALTGTAVAERGATAGAFSKKKAKKIAARQVKKLAPTLSVANAETAGDAKKLGGKSASGYASSTSEPYRDVGVPGQPQFQNGWSSFGDESAVGFYKDPLGVVHLKGIPSRNPGNDKAAFTLPPGYRPSQGVAMPAAATFTTSGPAFVSVGTDGAVVPVCQPGSACNIGIDGLTFRVG